MSRSNRVGEGSSPQPQKKVDPERALVSGSEQVSSLGSRMKIQSPNTSEGKKWKGSLHPNFSVTKKVQAVFQKLGPHKHKSH
jgi:hypothetical protein